MQSPDPSANCSFPALRQDFDPMAEELTQPDPYVGSLAQPGPWERPSLAPLTWSPVATVLVPRRDPWPVRLALAVALFGAGVAVGYLGVWALVR